MITYNRKRAIYNLIYSAADVIMGCTGIAVLIITGNNFPILANVFVMVCSLMTLWIGYKHFNNAIEALLL